MTNENADFTQGSILKKLVAFMIPILGSLILQAAYGAVDLIVVGRYGSTSGPVSYTHLDVYKRQGVVSTNV